MGLKLVRIGEHKASPLLCYGFASRCMHGGKGTFLSLHPEISLYVSFANKVIYISPVSHYPLISRRE